MKKFNLFVTYLVLPVYWIRSFFFRKWGSEASIYKELKRYPKHYFGFRRIKIKIHGDQPAADVPVVYVSNHQSMNDIFVTLGSVNRQFRFIAKKELFDNPITGTFMRLTKSYPLNREDARESLMILKEAVNDVNNGASVLAFPEGTRSGKKELLEFKDGIFSMLRKAKAPIVPMYIKESFNEQQKEINVYFGEALQPEYFNKLKGVELSEAVFDIMQELMVEAYR